MIYLLDTNAFSDVVREHPQVRARLAKVASEPVITCSIVRGEVIYGISRLAAGKRRRDIEVRSAQLFSETRCEPVPAPAGDEYARLKLHCESQGRRVEDNDLWIAATAIVLGATLVTRDADFRNIPGLSVED